MGAPKGRIGNQKQRTWFFNPPKQNKLPGFRCLQTLKNKTWFSCYQCLVYFELGFFERHLKTSSVPATNPRPEILSLTPTLRKGRRHGPAGSKNVGFHAAARKLPKHSKHTKTQKRQTQQAFPSLHLAAVESTRGAQNPKPNHPHGV